jgi:hypothetical protein
VTVTISGCKAFDATPCDRTLLKKKTLKRQIKIWIVLLIFVGSLKLLNKTLRGNPFD